MGSEGLPKSVIRSYGKIAVLDQLKLIDDDLKSRNLILKMESVLRENIDVHLKSLPTNEVSFSKLNTSPYVLLFYSKKKEYSLVSQIEKDIIPAKVFSSIETAAGNIIQKYVMPFYGWSVVDSSMQSPNSVIDIMKVESDILKIVSLKSGPRCLNDGMSKDIAQGIVDYSMEWAKQYSVDRVEFVYGVLYGTEKLSNKKDWHILRNISEMKGSRFMIDPPFGKWSCKFKNQGTTVDVKIKIGSDLWEYIDGNKTLLETAIALIRASVIPQNETDDKNKFEIVEFADITSLSTVPKDYNVSLLQRSQLQWLFFYLRHFYDELK
jgi:hypothetical protein